MPHEFTRSELYTLVWSAPMRVVASRHGISDVGLAKACANAHVPVPERGYWNKRHANKPTQVTPLPPRPPGLSDQIRIGFGRYDRFRGLSNAEALEPLPPRPAFEEPIDAVRERVQRLVRVSRAKREKSFCHPDIRKLLDEDKVRHEKQLAASYPIWDMPRFDNAFERRRFRLLDALLGILRAAGYGGRVGGENGQETSLRVGDRTVSFRVTSTQQPPKRATGTFVPKSSDLRLEILAWNGTAEVVRASWQDTAEKRLQTDIQEIAVEMIVAGELQHREAAQRYYEWRVERKAEAEAAVRQQAKLEEQQRMERQRAAKQALVDRLLLEAALFRQADEIRTYVREVIERVKSAGGNSDKVDRWAEWAHAQADRIDPVTNSSYLEALSSET